MYIYMYICIYIYIYIYISKSGPTVVMNNAMVPFSIATAPSYREGATIFLRLLHFTLNPYLIKLSVKQ